MADKRSSAVALIRERGGVLVALSGGVDSSVLLALAVEAVGRERVLAVTGRSASLAADELADARRVADRLGVRHEIVDTREIDRPEYRRNAGDRCFHCRTELFETLGGIARERGFPAVAYGAISDDLGDDRPGMRAASEHGVIAPLLDARLSKEDVRAIAFDLRLDVADKPAAACLSSRIPAGEEVTEEKLRQIEAAERVLRNEGFRQFRVRHHGAIARIELDSDGEYRIRDEDVRRRVAEGVRAAGFRFVAVDLLGYRTGSVQAVERPALYEIGPKLPSGQ